MKRGKPERIAADGRTFSEVAHQGHLICNPIAAARADRVIELLDLAPGARLLDAGCGKGEMLLRVVERWGAAGVGLDRSAAFLAEARARAAVRLPGAALAWIEAEVPRHPLPEGPFDLAQCIGATQLFGGYPGALRSLAARVRPGGLLLVGEGYWKRRPAAAYLRALGAAADDFTDHRGNIARARDQGLTLLYASPSGEDEWDHYEGLYAHGIEHYALAHPEDPVAAAWLPRIRRWHDVYLRWGRDTLGFALYLLAVPRR